MREYRHRGGVGYCTPSPAEHEMPIIRDACIRYLRRDFSCHRKIFAAFGVFDCHSGSKVVPCRIPLNPENFFFRIKNDLAHSTVLHTCRPRPCAEYLKIPQRALKFRQFALSADINARNGSQQYKYGYDCRQFKQCKIVAVEFFQLFLLNFF